MIGGVKIGRNPEKIKPPDRICQEFSKYDSPGFSQSEQCRPSRFLSFIIDLFAFVAVDIFEFFLRNPFLPGRNLVQPPPENQPDKSQRTGPDKCFLPSIMGKNPRNQRRTNNS